MAKNAPPSLVNWAAMRIRLYDAKHITQYGRSRATLAATGRCHWASIHHVLPQKCHDHQFWLKQLSYGVVKPLF
jgi:hypothetical protein